MPTRKTSLTVTAQCSHNSQTSATVCLTVTLYSAVAETQDAEESQACVVVTLVMLARGHVTLPQQTIRDPATFRTTMKHVSGTKFWLCSVESYWVIYHTLCVVMTLVIT